jgi:hypothetical protein
MHSNDLHIGRGTDGGLEVVELPREIEYVQMSVAWICGHGENAEDFYRGGRIHCPRHGQVPDDRSPTAQGEELRGTRLSQQLPRQRLEDCKIRVARIEHQLESQTGLRIGPQKIQAPLVEAEDLALEESLEESLSDCCRRIV